MIMKKLLKSKIFWILWGLLFAYQIVLSFFDLDRETASANSLLASPILMSLYFALIAPVIEEFAFRGWSFKNIIVRMLSLLLYSVFCVLFFKWWSILWIALMIYPVFFDRNIRRRGITLILLTGVVFALMHYVNYDKNPTSFLPYIPIYFGLGIIYGYASYKTGNILFSSILHIVNNSIACLFLLFYDPVGENTLLQHENVTITIEKQSITDNMDQRRPMQISDTLLYYDFTTLPNLICFLDTMNCKERHTQTGLAYYSVELKSNDGKPINRKKMIDFLIDVFDLKTSIITQKQPVYQLEVTDFDKLSVPLHIEGRTVGGDLRYITSSMQSDYDVLIHTDTALYKHRITLPAFWDVPFETLKDTVFPELGISLRLFDSADVRIRYVTY